MSRQNLRQTITKMIKDHVDSYHYMQATDQVIKARELTEAIIQITEICILEEVTKGMSMVDNDKQLFPS